jgi:hypothetical protein
MYAAMAFMAKIASDYRKPNGQFHYHARPSGSLLFRDPSRDGPLTRFTLDNRFYRECRAFGLRTPASPRDSLAFGIMRIVIRARTHGSYAFDYSLGGFCQPTRGGLRCE